MGTARSGYQQGSRERQLTTSLGPTAIMMPRVDGAILGLYLSGTNSRRVRGALALLLRGAPLSKDAVSRLVGRLREDFSVWSKRDPAADQVRYLFFWRLNSAAHLAN